MARPTRCRRVCAEPVCSGFLPRGEGGGDTVVLTVDEYEAIRLVDYEGRTHEQCAAQIAGGHYRVCRGGAEGGCGRDCRWALQTKRCGKGGSTMKIAVPYENGQVFQHFGHTSQMKIYDAEDGQVVREQVADTAGSGHGALAGFLSGLQVDVLICGGIGAGAQAALAQAGIRLCAGVTGSADEAVRALLAGRLDYQADVQCSHHDHGHHGGGHCGEDPHGCPGNGGRCGG